MITQTGFDPWVYDVDGDCYISQSELLAAFHDYVYGVITDEQELQVAALYENGTRNPACGGGGAKIFTSSDYYYYPANSLISALYAAPIYVDGDLFKKSAQIYAATVHTTVVPRSGFLAAYRRVEISTIGYQNGSVSEQLLTSDVWSPGASAPHENYVTITPFIYGIGLNLFPIDITVTPPFPQAVGFDITIQLSILWS
jgi:hypothetical protein